MSDLTRTPTATQAEPPSAHESAALAARIRASVPVRHPAFGKLLRLLSVEASREVPTAAVTTGARSRLLVNPDFVARHCRTDAHLTMLVLHELYHVLLGHTRMHPRVTLAQNWAFDCIINAQLCHLYPTLEYTSFFSAFTQPGGPWSLIGPPPGWPSYWRFASDAFGQVHRRLYNDEGATVSELFDLLERVAIRLDPADARRLLGSHGISADGIEGTREAAAGGEGEDGDAAGLREVARSIVARWPMEQLRSGADDGGALEAWRVDARGNRAARRALGRLLRTAAAGRGGGPRVLRPAAVPALVPIPNARDRRAQVQRLVGATPLLWHDGMQQLAREPGGEISVYLDVSGSMRPWLPVLLDAVTRHAALVRWPLLGFSTEVHPVSRAALASGRLRSTGGTDIACVARDLLHRRARRALIVTDGWVRELPGALVHELRRRHLTVHAGITADGDPGFCTAPGWHAAQLPPLDH